jgi:hypothetical protein
MTKRTVELSTTSRGARSDPDTTRAGALTDEVSMNAFLFLVNNMEAHFEHMDE